MKNSNPNRAEVKDINKWDTSKMYSSESEWSKDFQELEKSIVNYDKYNTPSISSSTELLEILDFDNSINRKFEKIFVFSHLKNDEDKTNTKYDSYMQKSRILYSKMLEKSSFINPLIQSIPESDLDEYLSSPNLQKYKFMLEKIVREKPYTLDKDQENLLSVVSETADAPSQIFSQLDNADICFGQVETPNGEIKELTHANFNTFLMDQNRSFRKNVFFQYYNSYDEHKYTLSTTLTSCVRTNWIYAKVRNHKSTLESSLFHNNISTNVYHSLLSTVKDNITPLSKYFSLRKNILGYKDLHIYDTYVPLQETIKFNLPYEEAVSECIKALEPLGAEYCNTLKKGLLEGWVDRYSNKGKRSGAYSSGCYDSYPYILLNYDENNINSLYTLIHEAGHSMHSYLSNNAQPYHLSSYSIFVAEVASTVNEFLLTKYLLNKYSDDINMKKYIMNREIENIKGTLFRQTMFAEFEKILFSLTEKDIPLNEQNIRKEYRNLLEIYFDNTIIIDDILELEALRIPHFYSPFYVYQYATGISSAISIGKSLFQEDKNIDNYHTFLKSGGSLFPTEQLKIAGIDIEKPEPVISALNYFSNLVKELENSYGIK